MSSFEVVETLNTLHCAGCRMLFAIPATFERDRRNDHARFYCPAGCHNVYNGETEAEKIRRERDRLKQDAARLEDEKREAQARAAKAEAAAKRLKKRASAGTCPCCSRTFANMAEHMKQRHPEMLAEGGTKVVPIKRPARAM